MAKFTKIAKLLLILVLIGAIIALVMLGSTEKLQNVDEIKLEIGNFGRPVDFTQEGYKDYKSNYFEDFKPGLEAGATSKQKAKAVYAIYRTACYSYFTAPYRATRSTGGGSAGTADDAIKGSMDVYSSNYSIHMPGNTAENKEQRYAYYGTSDSYSIVSGVVGGGDVVASIAANALGYGKKYSTTPLGETFNSSNASKVSTFPTDRPLSMVGEFLPKKETYTDRATLDKQKQAGLDAGTTRPYPADWNDKYGKDSPELSNHIINEDTILADSIKIVKKEEAGQVYYQLEFKLDCAGDATKYSAYSIQSTSSIINGLKYVTLDFTMQIWESGYFRSWQTAEKWEAGLDLKIVKIKGQSSANSREIYSYNKNEVLQGVADNWFGEKPWTLSNDGITIKLPNKKA